MARQCNRPPADHRPHIKKSPTPKTTMDAAAAIHRHHTADADDDIDNNIETAPSPPLLISSTMNDLLSLFILRSTGTNVNTNTNTTATDTDNDKISPHQQQQHSQQLVVDTSSSWDYLSLRDLYQLKCVSKATYESLEWVEYNRCRDGKGENYM